jgi:hypothetical protein
MIFLSYLSLARAKSFKESRRFEEGVGEHKAWVRERERAAARVGMSEVEDNRWERVGRSIYTSPTPT